MYRISVTTLEKFRRYMNEVSESDTEESLIESLKGEFKGNELAMIGSAYHKLIEVDTKPEGLLYRAEDIYFTKEQAEPAFNFKKKHPLMTHEIVCRKTYETKYFPIQVSGRVDGIEGVQIRDTKMKFSYIKWQEYLDSIQWRFYLDMLDADVFWYDVFLVKGFNALPPQAPYTLHDVTITYEEPMQCLRYANMSNDLQLILDQFLEFLHDRKLLIHLKPAMEETIEM